MARLLRQIVETMAQSRGLKMTPQRRAIIDYMQSAHHHPTADEVLQTVNRKFPMTSRATVYNTLNWLKQEGMIKEVFEAGCVRFDPNTEHHFLIGGHIDRDMEVIRTVLRALHLRLAPSPLVALISLVWRRARIRRRGLAFVARDPDHIPADSLLRIDTCWSVTSVLPRRHHRAADFNTVIAAALEAGHPYRIAGALALEATSMVSGGTGSQYAAECANARRLGEISGRTACGGAVGALRRHVGVRQGEWKKASLLCPRALGDPAGTLHGGHVGDGLRREVSVSTPC